MHSPGSDAFSAGNKTNGVRNNGAPKKPGSAFDLYCDEARPAAKDKAAKEGEGEADTVEEELSRGWKDLPDTQRDEYQLRADDNMAEYEKEKDEHDAATAAAAADKEAQEAADAEADAAEAEAEAKADREDSNDKAESTESDRPAAGSGAGDDERASMSRQQQQLQQEEDVEMANWDTDQETQGERPEE